MIVYVLAAIYSSLFAYFYQISRGLKTNSAMYRLTPKISITLSCLVLIILAGTRVDVGVDYPAYVEIFKGIGAGWSFDIEPGFVVFNKVIFFLSENPQWLFFASSAITIILMYRFIVKYSVNVAFSVFLYFGLCLIFFSFNTLRQFIAVSIVLMAFGPLLERKFIRYLVPVLIASTFHATALIMIPMYFLLNINLSVKKALLISGIAGGLYVFRDWFIEIFLMLYPQHEGSEFLFNRIEFSEIMISTSLILLIIGCVLLRKGRIKYSGDTKLYINIIFFILLAHIAFAWVPGINRILLYLDTLLIVIIPFVIYKFPRNTARNLLVLSVVFFSSYAFISTYVNDSHKVLPYRTVLFQDRVNYEGVR